MGADEASVQQALVAWRQMEAVYTPIEVDLFPENWHAWCVFRAMKTQWDTLVVPGGLLYTGLRYASLPIVMAACRSVRHRQPLAVLMPQLQLLELAAMQVFNKK